MKTIITVLQLKNTSIKSKHLKLIIIFLFCSFALMPGFSQEKEGEQDLAKAAQNPVGDLISVPLQNNTNFGFGPFDRTQNVLNIQPS